MTRDNLDALFVDPGQQRRIAAEAEFGLREIGPAIAALQPGARVLEIGCGTGYLLARLASLNADLHFWGLEPLGKGFAQFGQVLDRIEASCANITVRRDEIESYGGEGEGFDLIFSVNVFEHLSDWRTALDRACSLLAPGGSIIILCPNYAIPYEPHFSIPILFSGPLTHKLLHRHIERIERERDAAGLWQSLNFITVPQMRRHCRGRGYGLSFDKRMLGNMLDRLDTDAEFAARQANIARLARWLNRLGVGALSRRMPASLSPYMKATVTAQRRSR